MTALIEQLPGATFSAPNIVLPPLPAMPAGMAIWVYPGTNLAGSQNPVPAAPAVLQLGAPGYTTYSITGCLGGASPIGLDTGVKDDNKTFTLLFAARHTGDTSTAISVPIANNDNSTLFGVNVGLAGNGNLNCTTNGSGINRNLPVTNITNWKIYCISFDDVAHVQGLYNLTDGTQDVFTGTGTRNLSAAGNWYIGANPRTVLGTKTCDVAFAALIKGTAVTLAVAQQYAANIKANLVLRGLTIP